jgi:glycosyltransferase involved in cell wall biosynthesis
LLVSLNLEGKFVIQYSGNMGRTHDLESLVLCASELLPYDDIHFLFIGSGAKRHWLVETVRQQMLRNVTVLPPLDRSELTVSLNACDAAVISFVPGMAGVSVPSRMYNILAAGKPIIAMTDEESELAHLVEEERVGWVVKPEDVQALKRVILEARSAREERSLMSVRARAVSLDKYSYQMVIGKYRDLLKSLGHRAETTG